jgi:hypothetical protein
MNTFCVYRHVFPNGKSYIGISKDAEKRWRNGKGYETQQKMQRAIVKYGWDNVQHIILADRLTKELAMQLEQHYIAEYDSIKNGYNATIGGDNIKTAYLDPYVLGMIRGHIRFFPNVDGAASIANGDRLEKEAAAFWNEAAKAVTRKHRLYSATDERDVCEFWYYIGQYLDLYCMMQSGIDVSDWREKPIEQAIYDILIGKG